MLTDFLMFRNCSTHTSYQKMDTILQRLPSQCSPQDFRIAWHVEMIVARDAPHCTTQCTLKYPDVYNKIQNQLKTCIITEAFHPKPEMNKVTTALLFNNVRRLPSWFAHMHTTAVFLLYMYVQCTVLYIYYGYMVTWLELLSVVQCHANML